MLGSCTVEYKQLYMSTLRVQLLACKDRSSLKCMQAAEELSPEKLQEYKDIFSFLKEMEGVPLGQQNLIRYVIGCLT